MAHVVPLGSHCMASSRTAGTGVRRHVPVFDMPVVPDQGQELLGVGALSIQRYARSGTRSGHFDAACAVLDDLALFDALVLKCLENGTRTPGRGSGFLALHADFDLRHQFIARFLIAAEQIESERIEVDARALRVKLPSAVGYFKFGFGNQEGESGEGAPMGRGVIADDERPAGLRRPSSCGPGTTRGAVTPR